MCSVVMKEIFRLGPETVCFKLQSEVATSANGANNKVKADRNATCDINVTVDSDHAEGGAGDASLEGKFREFLLINTSYLFY